MSIMPEDTPPQQPRLIAVPADATDDLAAFFELLRQTVHEVVETDITAVEAAHHAEQEHKRRLSIWLDVCVLPLAIGIFIILQMADLIIFAEAAGLVPNFGLLMIRLIRGEFF